MQSFNQLVESRIEDAMRRGVFDNLDGAGKPLELNDDTHIPEELRAAYRILKNAGFVPPEIQMRADVSEAQQLVRLAACGEQKNECVKRLNFLIARLESYTGRPSRLSVEHDYLQKAAQKF